MRLTGGGCRSRSRWLLAASRAVGDAGACMVVRLALVLVSGRSIIGVAGVGLRSARSRAGRRAGSGVLRGCRISDHEPSVSVALVGRRWRGGRDPVRDQRSALDGARVAGPRAPRRARAARRSGARRCLRLLELVAGGLQRGLRDHEVGLEPWPAWRRRPELPRRARRPRPAAAAWRPAPARGPRGHRAGRDVLGLRLARSA